MFVNNGKRSASSRRIAVETSGMEVERTLMLAAQAAARFTGVCTVIKFDGARAAFKNDILYRSLITALGAVHCRPGRLAFDA